MSSTWSKKKVVLAHPAKSGEPRYALFELTKDSNLWPGEYTWSLGAYGSIEQVMHFIYLGARSVVGGTLCGYNGRTITPQGYIKGWMDALANPLAMERTAVPFRPASFAGSYFSKAINYGEVLRQHGLGAEADKLDAGEGVFLDLVGHEEVITALSMANNKRSVAFLGQALAEPRGWEKPCPELAYNPQAYRGKLPELPKLLRISTCAPYSAPMYFVEAEDGKWKFESAEYAVMADYVASLSEQALDYPKAYTRMIKAFGDSMYQCPIAKLEKMTVHLSMEIVNAYQSELQALGPAWVVDYGPEGAQVRCVSHADGLHEVCEDWRNRFFSKGYWTIT